MRSNKVTHSHFPFPVSPSTRTFNPIIALETAEASFHHVLLILGSLAASCRLGAPIQRGTSLFLRLPLQTPPLEGEAACSAVGAARI